MISCIWTNNGRMRSFVCILIQLTVFTFLGHGEVLFRDSIAYRNGALCVVADGIWARHSGATNELHVLDGKIALGQNQSEDVHALISGQPFHPSGSIQLFAAFTLTAVELPKGAGSYFAHFKDAGNGFRCRIFVSTNGAAAGCFRLGISSVESAPFAVIGQDLELNKNYRIACCYSLSDGTSKLWLNPQSAASAGIEAREASSPIQIVAFALRQSSGTGKIEIDDVMIATEFSDLFASDPVMLPPAISQQPQSVSVKSGEAGVLSVKVNGTPPFSFQWSHNGVLLLYATNATLNFAPAQSKHAGDYQVEISNRVGSVLSETAQLTVEKCIAFTYTNILMNSLRQGDVLTNSFLETTLFPGEICSIQFLAWDPDGERIFVYPHVRDLPQKAAWLIPQTNGMVLKGEFTFQARKEDEGAGFAASIEYGNSLFTNKLQWLIYTPTSAEQSVVITEILANPTSDPSKPQYNPLKRNPPAIDTAQADEYIELVNTADTPLDLSCWTISDSLKIRHCFPASFILSGKMAVIIHGGGDSDAPTNIGQETHSANQSAIGLSLNNSGTEMILLRNSRSNLISRLFFESSDLADDGSLTRFPDYWGPFVSQKSVSEYAVSPGRWYNGMTFSEVQPAQNGSNLFELTLVSEDMIELTWKANSECTYSVWQSDELKSGFTLRTKDLKFLDGKGKFVDTPSTEIRYRFYKISIP